MVVLRTISVWVLGLSITIFLFIVVLLSLLIDRGGRTIHSIGAFWCRILLALAGVRVTVKGAENIPEGRPVIFLSNHQGAFDIPALQGHIPVQFRWVAKKSLFKIPIIGWTMSLAGYIGIERGRASAAFKSIVEAAEKIKKGTSVLVFPEGTRSGMDAILPLKRGAFLLAVKSGVPIVPLGIKGTRDILKRGGFLIHPADVTVTIGEPIETKEADDKELLLKTKEALERILSWESIKE